MLKPLIWGVFLSIRRSHLIDTLRQMIRKSLWVSARLAESVANWIAAAPPTPSAS
jgi:hypothetical protein